MNQLYHGIMYSLSGPSVLLIFMALIIVIAWAFLSALPLKKYRTVGGWCVIVVLFGIVYTIGYTEDMFRYRTTRYLHTLYLIHKDHPSELANAIQRIYDIGGLRRELLHKSLENETEYLRDILRKSAGMQSP